MNKRFIRTDEYMNKLFIDAFSGDRQVHQDAEIEIKYDWNKDKLRAWCPMSNTWLQFPNALRTKSGKNYTADVIEMKHEGRETFYRVVKGSIRNKGSDIVVG